MTLSAPANTSKDIGGGWPLDKGHEAALSHVPLVWMVREAQRAGLEFDEDKLAALNCCHEDRTYGGPRRDTVIPAMTFTPSSPAPDNATANGSGSTSNTTRDFVDHDNIPAHYTTSSDDPFHRKLHYAATKGRMHDVLQFKNGATAFGTISWNIMEYLPFRRMDLCENGSWKAIRWPLPKGETRDIPANATIHCSAIKRMFADETYRPGNLIVGGGGRGVRHAPSEMGIGKWVCHCEDRHPVGECFVRKEKPVRKGTDKSSHSHSSSKKGGSKGNHEKERGA